MPELSQQEIIAAVAANRMSAQEAYALLQARADAGPAPSPDLVLVTRDWRPVEINDLAAPAAGGPRLVLVASGQITADAVSQAGSADTLVELPESLAGPDADRSFDEFWAARVRPQLADAAEVALIVSSDEAASRNPDTAALFRVTQALLRARPSTDLRLTCQVLRADERALAWAHGCWSFLRCVAMENPRLQGRVVLADLPLDAPTQGWLARIGAAQAPELDQAVLRLTAAGALARLDAVPTEPAVEPESALVDLADTAFVITGGTGGLARLIAPALIGRDAPSVMLWGRRSRSDLDAEFRAMLDGVEGRIGYETVNLTSQDEIAAALDRARGSAPKLCVLHAAGVRNDEFLIKQDLDTFIGTAQPKADLAELLLDQIRSQSGARLVAFSSVTALLGNVGQSAYAFANGYLDGLAVHQAQQGDPARLVSIGWPLWAQGGMQIDDSAQEMMRSLTGMVPLETQTGIDWLLATIKGDHDGARALLCGDAEAIRSTLQGADQPSDPAPAAQVAVDDAIAAATEASPTGADEVPAEELHRQTCRFLVDTISAVTEIPAGDILLDEPFDQFGLDSIVAMRIGDALEANFAGLSKTLLFEYQNVSELADYFIAAHRATLTGLLGLGRPGAGPADAAPVEDSVAARPSTGSADPAPVEAARAARPISAELQPEPVDPQPADADRPRPATRTEPQPLPADPQPKVTTDAPASVSNQQRPAFAAPAGPAAPVAGEGIAIVGLAGRYPKAESVEQFWQNLVGAVDSIIEIPESRWDREQFFSPKKGELGLTNSRWGGFLEGIDQFDPRLFHINAREAAIMDPQERLFLETAWTAVEDAGYRPGELRGQPVAVFAGAMYTEYQMLPSTAQGRVIAHSSLHSSIANRVSYYLDLTGPSVALDTMCSSSLVAVHYACRAILDGEASMAVAGGVNVSLTPEKYLFLSQGNFLSSDGRCRAFGSGGDGYVPSEGVGVVVLKPLADAERDGDHIYGVIRGSAVNHDGKTSGYTVPSPKAQAEVISRALAAGSVDPAEVSYIEAHGTGTELGDPIEIAGLSQVFPATPPAGRSARAIGSVKSNIGHAESAAGIASLTKVLLQLQHRELAPSIHAEQLNPIIDFAGSGFSVQRTHEPWQVADGTRRIAGISCFGAGGTNCHLVVEEYPAPRLVPSREQRVFVPFSSASPAQLQALIAKFVEHLEGPEGQALRLEDIAYTMHRGRELMPVRLVVFASSVGELVARLTEFLADGAHGPDLVYRPEASADPDTDFFLGTEPGRELIGRFVERRQLAELARIWLKGYPIDAARLYPDGRRISLPTHVFDHASYWIPQETSGAARGRISELLDANDSDLDGIRFTTTFEAGTGSKARFVGPDGQLSPFAGVQVVADAYAQLTGDQARALRYLRFAVGPQGEAPLRYTVRAARGGLGVICESSRPDGSIVVQASICGTELAGGEELPEIVRDALAADQQGDRPDGPWLRELTTVDGQQAYRFDSGVDDLGSALSAALAGCLLVLGHRADEPGLLEVMNLTLWADAIPDVIVASPARVGAGLDLACYDSRTGVLVARADAADLAAGSPQPAAAAAVAAEPAAPQPASRDVADFVLDICADLFGVARERLDSKVPFDEYGMDSVLIGRFADRIRTRFPDVPDAIFFDHDTIGSLVDHLAQLSAPDQSPAQPVPHAEPAPAQPAVGGSDPAPSSASITSLIRSGEQIDDEPVAIIGMSGVFPEAPDLATYWRNLLAGRESISLVPPDRWDYRPFFDPQTSIPTPGTVYAPWGGFVDDPFGFDNRFFNITPADAVVIDPQERMLLETVWHTLEDAGVTRGLLGRAEDAGLQEDVGVFVGTTSQTYQFWGVEESLRGNPVLTNASPWSLANRISYFFDFSGPSMPIDTACSSGLSAVHLALESLRSGECTSAIAAGVNLFLHPLKYVSMCQMKMLSPTGRLSAFGADGNGFVPGEGVAALLLKPLSKALADGDRIRAVIRSSTVNHGGRTNGYTVPSVSAQSRLLQRAWQQAGIDPQTIGYLEMHGTGTKLGDPIEVEAATQAMRTSTERRGFCAIGSVKPNIGHLESCSGLASLIKVVRQLETGTMVPSINASPRNPRLELETSPFFITEQQMPWHPDERSGVRRAGISSFGAGGANAHIVVESYESGRTASPAEQPQVLVLSARTPDRLPLLAERLAERLSTGPDDELEDVAWTLQKGREPLAARVGFVAEQTQDAIDTLRRLARGEMPETVVSSESGSGAAPAASGRTGELTRLTQEWVRGAEVDWDGLHQQHPRIVSLPGYSFEHTRYRVEHGERAPLPAVEAEQVARIVRERREDTATDPELRDVHPETSTYAPVWEEVASGGAPVKSWSGRSVALLSDESQADLRASLTRQLRERGASVTAFGLTQWAEADQADPQPGTDLIVIPQRHQIDGDDLTSPAALSRDQDEPLLSFLAVMQQVLARPSDSGDRDVLVLTDRVHDRDGAPQRPYGAGASALLRSAVKEDEGVRGVAVDLDLTDSSGLDQMCARVLDLEPDAEVPELMVRSGVTHVQRLAGVRLPLAERVPAEPDSVHVIVGGLGSVGFAYAEHLVKARRARVCLIGRSRLDADKRLLLARLGDSGVHHLYRDVDATDAQALRAVLDEVTKRWGGIDSLVHSAMVFDETPVADLSEQTFMSVLAPKTRVLQAMVQAADGLGIGQLLCFSSSQAFLGTRNRSHYAAACAALQGYLAALRPRLGMAIHRIDWGFWGTDKGRRISETFENFLAVRGIRPISAPEGMDIVERVLANSVPEVSVLTISERVKAHLGVLSDRPVSPATATGVSLPGPDASAVRQAGQGQPGAPQQTPAEPDRARPAQAEPAQTEPAEPATGGPDLVGQLVGLLARVIAADERDIDPAASFMDIGLDSISGLRFVQAVNEGLSIELGDTVIFDYPTIESLAEYIDQTHGDRLRAKAPAATAPAAQSSGAVAGPKHEQPDGAQVLRAEDPGDLFVLFKKLESRELTPDEVMALGEDDHAI